MAFCQSIASPDHVMQLADAELYKAKADGRNTFHMAAHEQ
jgi:PleD family two-component response regulator